MLAQCLPLMSSTVMSPFQGCLPIIYNILVSDASFMLKIFSHIVQIVLLDLQVIEGMSSLQ